MSLKQKIKLIVSDLDGTLLNRSSLLTAANRRAVLALKERGILFTFATGRMDKMTWHYAEELALELPIISCNGAMLRYKGQEDWFYRRTIAAPALAEIKRLCDRTRADYLFYGTDTVYHRSYSRRVDSFRRYNQLAEQSGQAKLEIVCLDDLPDGLPPEEITKSFVVFPEGEDTESELGRALAAIDGAEAVVSVHGACDLMPPGSSKGDAVEKLAERLGIPMTEVCCLGDQANDITMLQKAGLAIGMRSGSPLIFEFCDYIAEHYNCDGFARALNQFILY